MISKSLQRLSMRILFLVKELTHSNESIIYKTNWFHHMIFKIRSVWFLFLRGQIAEIFTNLQTSYKLQYFNINITWTDSQCWKRVRVQDSAHSSKYICTLYASLLIITSKQSTMVTYIPYCQVQGSIYYQPKRHHCSRIQGRVTQELWTWPYECLQHCDM
jgi:hypothetical protein